MKMRNCKKKISKDDYEKYKDGGEESLEWVHEQVGIEVLCGYGLYGHYFQEKDGEYWLVYTTGSSCD